jgi:hypothetical protein
MSGASQQIKCDNTKNRNYKHRLTMGVQFGGSQKTTDQQNRIDRVEFLKQINQLDSTGEGSKNRSTNQIQCGRVLKTDQPIRFINVVMPQLHRFI